MTPNLHFLTHPRVARTPELSWLGSELRENVAPPLTLSEAEAKEGLGILIDCLAALA